SHSVSSSLLFFQRSGHLRDLHSFPTRRSSDLTAISLFEPELISDDTTRQIVEILKEGSEHLQETLNNHIDILSQQNSLHVPLEQLDLKQALQNVTSSISSLIVNTAVTFHVDFSAFEKILFNKAYLESIFLNLITNSIKYARPDCPPEISIYSTKTNGVNQLVISDNGQGFDMEKVRGRIFRLNQKFHNHSDS